MHPGIEFMEVSDRKVRKIGYDIGECTLIVEFKNMILNYYGVPRTLYDRLKMADSVVGFLAANVNGKYEYLRR